MSNMPLCNLSVILELNLLYIVRWKVSLDYRLWLYDIILSENFFHWLDDVKVFIETNTPLVVCVY